MIAVVLLLAHDTATSGALLTGVAQTVAGVIAGFVIGIVAALMGVAGGELLIPTLVRCSAPTSSLPAASRLRLVCRR